VPRLRRCLVFLEAIDALTRAAIACRVFDAKHIPINEQLSTNNAFSFSRFTFHVSLITVFVLQYWQL
jgi:hypothetical protein